VPALIEHWRLVIVAAVLPCAVLGQPQQWPNADDMARARKSHPFPTPQQLESRPTREAPRLAPNHASLTALDLSDLARQGSQLSAPTTVHSNAPQLRIFISLAMPRPSLERLVDQASRTGATLVLRGLKAQSLRQTLAAVRPLIETHRVAWVIDPEAFARYQVTVAPTFVLTQGDATQVADRSQCHNGCTNPTSYVSVAGDVSLGYALDAMSRQRPALVPAVAVLLEQLRGS